MAKAQIYKSDGTIEDAVPANGKDFTLEEAQKICGGYVQMLYSDDGKKVLLMNEDAKQLPELRDKYNTKATELVTLMPGDIICGDVLVCDPEMFQ